jgi:hypothetical protein
MNCEGTSMNKEVLRPVNIDDPKIQKGPNELLRGDVCLAPPFLFRDILTCWRLCPRIFFGCVMVRNATTHVVFSLNYFVGVYTPSKSALLKKTNVVTSYHSNCDFPSRYRWALPPFQALVSRSTTIIACSSFRLHASRRPTSRRTPAATDSFRSSQR